MRRKAEDRIHLGEARLLVGNGKQAQGVLAQNHVQKRLIVLVLDLRAIDTLLGHLIELQRDEVKRNCIVEESKASLHLENVVVEEELQLFVGEIDQKLLKAVLLEALEAEDVQDTYTLIGQPAEQKQDKTKTTTQK